VYEPVPLHESSIDFTTASQRTRLDLFGYNMSANEHAILEEIINTDSISTVKGIQLASASGMPVLTFSPGVAQDVAAPLHLSTAVELAIENALNAGSSVMVPQDPISIHDWVGAVYIRQDVQPTTFSFGYIIEDELTTQGGATTTPIPQTGPPVPQGAVAQQFYAGDPVNPANGNMFRDETDISIPSIGIPLQFTRHYDSQSAFDVGLGLGWLHTYSEWLAFEADGNITWTRSDGTRHTFEAMGNSSYRVPQSLHGTFTVTPTTYAFRNKDGTTTEFDLRGQFRSVTDRNGNTIVVTRKSNGQIDYVSDAFDSSRRLTLAYQGDHIASVQDFTGRSWTYAYISLVNPTTLRSEAFLSRVTSPSDAVTEPRVVQYDYYSGVRLHGLMQRITEPDGGSHHYSYYPNRRAFEITDALGHSTALSYDLFRNVTDFLDERRATTKYVYNDTGMLLEQISADHNRETYRWQDFLMLSRIDALGNVETYEYFPDGLGNLKRTVNSSGLVTQFTYDPTFSAVSAITINPGEHAQLTQFVYDSNGNVTQIIDAEGNKTTMSYAGCSTGNRGQVCSRTEPKGNLPNPDGNYTTAYTYNAAGQVTTVTTGLPSLIVNSYDDRGNLLSTTDPTGIQTTYTYDLLGRQLTATLPDPDGTGPLGPIVTAASYDAMGRTLATVDPNGHTISHTYDLKGDRIRTIRGDGTATHYTFDEVGNQVAVIDELGRKTETVYDTKNLPIAVFQVDGSTTRTSYDGNGRVLARADELGNTTRYQYDAAGRLLENTDALGQQTRYTYDVFGNLSRITDRRGAATEYAYDKLNRVTQVRGPDGLVTTTDYDANGNATRSVRYDFSGLGDIPDDPRTLSLQLQRVEQSVYDVANRRTQQIDALNQSTYFTYDAAGRLTAQQDALGRISNVHYDQAGRKIRLMAADPDGAGPLSSPVTTYTLDAAGNVLALRDPLNRSTTFEYDGRNRVIARHDAAGFSDTFTFDPNGQLVTEQDAMGRVRVYRYDEGGRRIQLIMPDPDWADGVQVGPTIRWEYDASGNVTAEIDELGRVTRLDYDALGRRTRQTLPDPDGAGPMVAPSVTSVYDSEGNVVRSIDQTDRNTTVVFDASRRAIQTITPDPDAGGPANSPSDLSSYDALGNRVRTIDALGRVTQYQFDALGRNTRLIEPDPDGAGPQPSPVSETVYDAVGNVITVIDAMAHATSYQYDRLNRKTRETLPDPDGSGPLAAPFTTLAYDAVGNLTSSANALGEATTNEYDSLNRLIRQIDPRGASTTVAYDALGNRLRLTDPELNDTTFTYDRLNRLVRETNELGASRMFSYDDAGNLLTETDRNGRVREFTHDALDRVVAERWLQGSTTVRTINTNYDSAGRVVASIDPDSSITFNYDALDRLVTVAHSGTSGAPAVTWSYTYDAAGNQLSRDELVGGQSGASNTYSFDHLDRMIRVQQSGPGVASKRVDLAYNQIGQLVTLSRYSDLPGTQLVAQSTYAYDAANRLSGLSHRQGSNVLGSYGYQFDSANRITRSTSTADANGTSNYSYDTASQLTAANHTYQANEAFAYDAAGNRTSGGFQYGLDNRLSSDGTYTYQYDAEGNRVRRTRIATGDYTVMTWDHRNRLTQVTSKTTAGIVTQQVDYRYDSLDRRISRAVDSDGAGPATASWDFFVFDADNVALHYRDFDGAGPQPTGLASRLLHGPAVDQVLADESAAHGLLWPLTDHQGTVRDLVRRGATATEVLSHVVYDSFGRITHETAPSVDHLYGYTGRERDESTGLINYRARWYDPGVGRFLSEDPTGFAGGDTNLARYVMNSPVNATDPTGMVLASPITSTFADLQTLNPTLMKSIPFDEQPYSLDEVVRSAGPEILARSEAGWLDWSERAILDRYVHNQLEVPDASIGWPGPTPNQLERLAAARNHGLFGWIGQLTGAAETEQFILAEIQAEKNQWVAQRALNWSQQHAGDGHPLIQYFQLNEIAAQPVQREMRLQLQRPVDAMLTLSGVASMADAGVYGGVRALKLPQLNPSLSGTATLAETTMDGRVFVQPGLSWSQQAQALRHESVHVFLTPKTGPFVDFRQSLSQYGYGNSAFLQATEEMMAHTYATKSVRQGLLHPFNGNYWVRHPETIVTPRLYLAEGAGIVTAVSAASYGANRLGKAIWHQKP
jgi:RHS repeat-associated protein